MLTSLQIRVAKLFLSLPEACHFALAGGAALIFKNEVARHTQDLDFFCPLQNEVRAASESLQKSLASLGLRFQIVSSSPSFVRMIVQETESNEEVVVDIGHDYRLKKPDDTEIGPVLSTEELAADKLLALFGRAEARDFVDVYHLMHKFGVASVLHLAKEKDTGFDPYILAIEIGKLARLPRKEFEVDDLTYQELQIFFRNLRAELLEKAL
ncbi:MAG: nucleotidyl transferase AbiEii/AbiGii toxin family protein [Syntrophomonadaceae bacterium]|jgi:hypothetical protein|nr:nucleotidyl transferase AbiEii/AbiGii toxin family protein [Syntrophomonadaceae bacterium]